MIIKRKLILSEELFSNTTSEEISIISTRFCEEVIKLCEMFTKYTDSSGAKGQYSLHWIKDKLWGQGIKKLITISDKKPINPLVVWYYKIDDENRKSSRIVEDYVPYKDFIREVKKEVTSKYGIHKFKFSDEDYKKIFKYIALILSEKIEPELYQTSPWWGDSVKLMNSEEINYTPKTVNTSIKPKVIKNLIITFLNINEEGEENSVLLRALNQKDFN